jgi:endonuclease/exonuclease/phosphatase (EEP) superfamily protein YafD
MHGFMKLRSFAHFAAGVLGIVILVVGMTFQLTVRDGGPPWQVLFYALPLPVILVGWLLLALWHLKRRFVMGCCLGAALSTALWWQHASWRPYREAPAVQPREIKIFYWNMGHQPLPSVELENVISQHLPDIVGLGEVGLRSGDPNPLARNLPPGYIALKPEHGMGFLVRQGTAKVNGLTKVSRRSKFLSLDVSVHGRMHRILLVDGDATPALPRQDLLYRTLAAGSQPGCIIMGDFNTPLESMWFDFWRAAGLRHGGEASHSGFRETWPSPWPVLTIDHIWCAKDLRPVHLERIRLKSSDHVGLMVRLAAEAP